MPTSFLCYGLYHKLNNILYGISTYGLPLITLEARNATFLGKAIKRKYRTKTERLKAINKLVVCGQRHVIHPSIRGSGFASFLINEAHKRIPKPFIEEVSVQSYYSNFYPKGYEYFVKVSQLQPLRYLYKNIDTGSDVRGRIRKRIKSAEQKYGYALYVNRELLKAPEFSSILF